MDFESDNDQFADHGSNPAAEKGPTQQSGGTPEGDVSDDHSEHSLVVPPAPPDSDTRDRERALILLNNKPFRELVAEVVMALRQWNHRPRLFNHWEHLTRVALSAENIPQVRSVTSGYLQLVLSDAADFIRTEGGLSMHARPDRDVARAILSLSASEIDAPPLRAIVSHPVFREDFSLVTQAGYDTQTGLYLVSDPELSEVPMHANWNRSDALRAGGTFYDAYSEFPFADDRSRHTFLGFAITPGFQYCVGRIPALCVRANQISSGKTTLEQSIAVTYLGTELPTYNAPQPNSEEWGKLLLSILRLSPRFVLFDNASTFESSALALLLTAERAEGRLLRTNEIQMVSSNSLFLVNGNHLRVGPDLRRRVCWVHLQSKTHVPKQEHEYRSSPFLTWVKSNRCRLFTASLTMAQAWVAAGCPPPRNVPDVASFGRWSQVIGGVLEFAGFDSFLGNYFEMVGEADPEQDEWAVFLATLYSGIPEQIVTSRYIMECIKMSQPLRDAAPDCLLEAIKRDSPQLLANQLRKIEGQRFSEDGLRIERLRENRTKVMTWVVRRDRVEQ